MPQAEALTRVLDLAGIDVPILMAVDTGMGREGVRSTHDAIELAGFIASQRRMGLRGIYSHEGHAYAAPPGESGVVLDQAYEKLMELRDAIDSSLSVWPGCSVTASRLAAMPGISAVRPGTYVFGDLSLTLRHNIMEWDDLAATVLTTVVDRPSSDLALLDSGSKTLSGDKTPDGISAAAYDRRQIYVSKCSEEHGWATGPDVDDLSVGERIRLVPAHICPAVNLAAAVTVVRNGQVIDVWPVSARGRVD
jgi:D-serine deaminase-like pyridoxal phosphate-dependent protein